MRKALIFIKKDFLEEINYPITFLSKTGVIILVTIETYLVGKIFIKQASPYLSQYGGDFFTFAIIGIAFARFFLDCTNTLPNTISAMQSKGTLEILLTTSITPYELILYSSLWPFINAFFNLFLYLSISFLFFKGNIAWINSFSAFMVIIISTVSFFSLGIISAVFCLVSKRRLNISEIQSFLTISLAGTCFPITLFPEWLQKISHLLPLTYFLDCMRQIFINGVSLVGIRYNVLILIVFAVFLFPTSLLLFRVAINRLKRDGTAVFY